MKRVYIRWLLKKSVGSRRVFSYSANGGILHQYQGFVVYRISDVYRGALSKVS